MVTEADIITRVRIELGDQPEPFRQTYRGTGYITQYDLPCERVSESSIHAYSTDTQADPIVNTDLVLGTDFTVDAENGIVTLASPLQRDLLLTVEGTAFGLFTDDELTQYVRDAVLQHCHGDTSTTRYRDAHGFIRYETVAKTLDNLDPVEELPVAILAAIQCLWVLLVDASTDIDIETSEGTHVPRSQRFAQLQAMVAALTDRYKGLCAQLNVGLYRIEISNLRRVSRQTGRLVPLFVEREYDESTLPVRIVPRIDSRDADPDGPPSPAGNYFW